MRARTGLGAAALAALALAIPAGATAQDHDHGDHDHGEAPKAPKGKDTGKGKIGLLIADHGEPPVYNADTYESFRAFIDHLMEMGVIPPQLKAIDTGTVLQDPKCYACSPPQAQAPFINAWLGAESGPAVPSGGFGDAVPPHHFLPGSGRGQGEPDIFEHSGLQSWNEWRLMGGSSPNYAQKLEKKELAIKALLKRFGKRLVITTGYGIDPRVNGAIQDIHTATHELMERGVREIVVVYHGVGFSDLMQTHMIRHEVEHTLANHGSTIPIRYAGQMGLNKLYRRAVVRKALRELDQLPERAPVAIQLSGHGLPTSDCGAYACGADPYHANSLRLFTKTAKSLRKAIKESERNGRTGVFRHYGDGATDADDPGELVDSPIEALDKRAAEGFAYLIDIPFEFDSDSRDTLIVLRQGYGRPIPDWDAEYVSRFSQGPLQVEITNASFGRKLKARALEAVAAKALVKAGLGSDEPKAKPKGRKKAK